jgi:hypothetical protein
MMPPSAEKTHRKFQLGQIMVNWSKERQSQRSLFQLACGARNVTGTSPYR